MHGKAGTASGPSRFFSPAAHAPARLLSLDVFRGAVIAAMIWVNYIAGMPAIPYWLEHASARADGITLPDTVFPAFLFIVGVATPLALHRHVGNVTPALAGRILWRAAGLMITGVVLANAYRYDDANAVLPRAWFFVLFYLAVILLWRQGAPAGPGRDTGMDRIRDKDKDRDRDRLLAWLGGALMVFVLLAFRGTVNAEFDSTWLQPSWWGILGMIGWSYLLCSAIYLALRGRRMALVAALAGLVALYFAGMAGAFDALPASLRGFVNIPQLLGSTAANVMAGVVVGTLFVPGKAGPDAAMPTAQRLRFMAGFAVLLLGAGLLLRPWYGINKIHATASYTLVCAALALALFLACHVLVDVLQVRRGSALVLPAGANAVFAYIAPDLWENLAAGLGLPRFWWPYWQDGGAAGLLNALAMTAAVLALTALVTRAGLRLKF
jgi:heparan-alpha-glucosaminide N-acetyltransferase